MSLIRRSSRWTSSRMIAIRLRCWLGSVTRATVSTALRSEVSGFLISWATSAAKCSIASMRAHKAPVIARRSRLSSPISSPRAEKSGISTSRPWPPPHPLGRRRQPPQRPADRAGEIERQRDRDRERDREDLQHADTDGAQAGLDLAAVRRQHERADDLFVALHRHGDGEHDVAAGIVAHDAHLLAEQGPAHLLVVVRRLLQRLDIAWQIAGLRQPPPDRVEQRLHMRRRQHAGRRRQLLDPDDAARRFQGPCVEHEHAIGREQPGPRIGRRDEPAQQVRRCLGDQLLAFVLGRFDGTGAERPGEDLALNPKRLDLGVDQTLPVLVEEEHGPIGTTRTSRLMARMRRVSDDASKAAAAGATVAPRRASAPVGHWRP